MRIRVSSVAHLLAVIALAAYHQAMPLRKAITTSTLGHLACILAVGLVPLILVPMAAAQQSNRQRVAADAEPAKLTENAIRRVVGEHVVLYTDHPVDSEVDALPRYFDQAHPQWCDYFSAAGEKNKPWRVNAYLMVDAARFRRAGLFPDDLPRFLHGYSRGLELWLHEQPTPYYRRHLLLHEGTHAFMEFIYGGIGPPWYAEGIAELLATHALTDGQLRLHYFPRSREETPQLGRIKLVQDEVAAGRRLTIGDVMSFGPGAHIRNEPYAWSWALATIIEQRPSWRAKFRSMQKSVGDADFNRHFAEQLEFELRELHDTWAVFTTEITHAYDLDRAAIEFAPGKPLGTNGTMAKAEASRGWQSTGVELSAGKKYRVTASGRCEMARTSKPWTSEPGGVSIQYYRGRPLGRLLAVIRPDNADVKQPSAFLEPLDVGLNTVIEPTANGTLYFRINDSPAMLADNSGHYEVRVVTEP